MDMLLGCKEEVESSGGKRRRETKRERKLRKSLLKVGSLNAGTTSGKGREVADLMERRRMGVLCVQETR